MEAYHRYQRALLLADEKSESSVRMMEEWVQKNKLERELDGMV